MNVTSPEHPARISLSVIQLKSIMRLPVKAIYEAIKPRLAELQAEKEAKIAAIEKMANGASVLGRYHCREGVVVRPLVERSDDRLGRVHLKLVGTDYLERS